MTVKEYIAANEFDWWHKKLKKSEVRKLILENTGLRIGRENGVFKQFVIDNMYVYGHWKRKPVSNMKNLSDDQWEKLKTVVESLKTRIEGQGIAIAFEIIRTKVSTNILQLRGLPNRMHYWKK